MEYTFRDYQEETVEKGVTFFEQRKKSKPSVLVAPVASGKSLIIGGITSRLVSPTLILQPSVELLSQNYKKLLSFGGKASIYSASANSKEMGHVTYATLGSIKNMGKEFREFGVKNVLIDEVHFGYSPVPTSTFRKFMKALAPKHVLGLTATPLRLKPYGSMDDSWSQLNFMTRGTPRYFSQVLHVVDIQMMVERGYWSKLVYETYDFDEGKLELNSTGAEFTEHSIKDAIVEQGVNNNIYLRIKKLIEEGRKNILVFCDSLETAKKMASLFPKSACVHGQTPKKERKELIERFVDGDLQIVTNFGTLTTGFDHPRLDAVIFGRPTQSLSLFYQMAGRGTRIHKDKEDCMLIDFCNNVKRFGKLEDLNFEYIEGFGWALFTKDRLLSNVRMGGMPVYKKELLEGVERGQLELQDIKMWFGKFSNTRVSELPTSYIKWALLKWDFKGKKLKMVREQMVGQLEKRNEIN